MLLIGSKALAYHCPDFRRPLDIDLVATLEEFEHFLRDKRVTGCVPIDGGRKYIFRRAGMLHEVEIAWPGSTGEQLLAITTNVGQMKLGGMPRDFPTNIRCAPMDLLLTLKMSHRFKKDSPHFTKTRLDILFLRSHHAVIRAEYLPFFHAREVEQYNYLHPRLNVTKAAFFTDEVPYLYDHDSLHQAMKHLDRPAYEFFKPDAVDVMTCKRMFNDAPHNVKLLSVLEEAYVLALERSQIPYGHKVCPSWSFDKALEKLCTSISSGWWREFAWEHFDAVRGLYDEDYTDRFKAALTAGIVKPYKT